MPASIAVSSCEGSMRAGGGWMCWAGGFDVGRVGARASVGWLCGRPVCWRAFAFDKCMPACVCVSVCVLGVGEGCEGVGWRLCACVWGCRGGCTTLGADWMV